MANQGDQTVYIGNSDWFRGDPQSMVPQTELIPNTVQSMVGGYVRLDGSQSYTVDELDVLYYDWVLVEAPLTSVEPLGAINIGPSSEWDKPILTREVLAIGRYQYSLQIVAANGGAGVVKTSFVLALVSNAPLFDNIALDSSWIWQLLPDYWNTMPFEDRHKVEVLWRGVSQALGSDLLNLYSVDNNKSIATIQDRSIKRWDSIHLEIPLEDNVVQLNSMREAEIEFGVDAPSTGVDTVKLKKDAIPEWGDLYESKDITFSAAIMSLTEISPVSDPDNLFQPAVTDVGLSITIQIGATSIETKISYVEVNWKGGVRRVRYVLADDIFSSSINDLPAENTVRCTLHLEAGNTLPIPIVLGNELNPYMQVVLATGFDKDSSTLLLNQSVALPTTHTRITALPSIKLVDADIQGVSSGDVVYIGVSKVGSAKQVALKLEVVGITSTESVNDEFYVLLKPKTAFRDLGISTIKALHSEYEDALLSFKDLIDSPLFKRRAESMKLNPEGAQAFYSLSTGSKSNVYRVTPIKLVRYHKVGLHSNVVNMVKLSEFIEEHDFDGKGSIVTDGKRVKFLQRDPIFLLENRDFYIQSGVILGYDLSYDSSLGSDATALFSDLSLNFPALGVEPGDALTINAGFGTGEYTIVNVSTHSLEVSPKPNVVVEAPGIVFENTKYSIYPRLINAPDNPYEKYIIFNTDILKTSTPKKLWVETFIESNDRNIDLNFGSLVSFPYNEWASRGLTNSYKSVITGLLASRLLGSSLESIMRAIGIVSGIPYAEEPGKIIHIDRKAEVDSFTGEPTKIKIVVAGMNIRGEETQSVRSYMIPARSDFTHAPTSGLNSGTSLEGRLQVNDNLELFDLVGMGVVIEDIVTNSRGRFDSVKDRNRFRVTINFDSSDINTGEDVEFLYDFIVDIKPAYIEFILALMKFLVDKIEIKSKVGVKYRTRFFDNAYLLRGPAEIYDDEVPGRALNEAPAYNVLTTWFPSDGKVVIDGSKLKLSSQTGYFERSRLSDGVITTSVKGVPFYIPHNYTTSINSVGDLQVLSWIRGSSEIEGSNRAAPSFTLPDYVVFRGKNRGVYRIEQVLSDNELSLQPLGPNNESLAFFEEGDVPFVVVRLANEVVYDGILQEAGLLGIRLIGEGVINDGIAAYDEIGFVNDTVNRYVLERFKVGFLDGGVPAIFAHRDTPFPQVNHQYPTRVIVRRPQIALRERGTFELTKLASDRGSYLFMLTEADADNIHTLGVNVGDHATYTYKSKQYDTWVVGIFGNFCWLAHTPIIENSTPIQVRFTRPTSGFGAGALDQPDGMVMSSCSIIVRSTTSERRRNAPGSAFRSAFVVKVINPYTFTIMDKNGDPSENILNTLIGGDMLKVTSLTRHSNAPTHDFTNFLFTEGDGILRVVEVIDGELKVAQPLPIEGGTFIGMEFNVKIIKQANLSSVYWRT
jgi:hypothetical protein